MSIRPLLAASSLALLAACSSSSSGPATPTSPESPSSPDHPSSPATATSTQSRVTPSVAPADAEALRAGDAAFAGDLYQKLAALPDFRGKSMFFSPYSISLAMAMTYAGARGTTATQTAAALHFTLPQEKLHPAFDALDLALSSRGQGAKADDGKAFRLRVANSMWGSPKTTFGGGFLDTLAQNYGAGVRLTDFGADPEAARGTINAWVDQETEDRIKDLLPPGSITQMTRLVLVNAVYFNAAWATPFEPRVTKDGTFHGAGGDVTAKMMSRTDYISYGKGDGWEAVSLPYDGKELSFVAVLPTDLAAFEASLTGDRADTIARSLSPAEIALTLPKFKIEGASFSVASALNALGMTDAFDGSKADFSGMATSEKLYLSDVIHKAFVSVDEAGTEAAAATAAILGGTSATQQPPPVVTLDRPFVFFIRDDATGAILFLGRVLSV